MNIRDKNIRIERSVRFEEPLQDLKLLEDETIEIPSLSAEDYGDENESMSYDILDMMYDISENEILCSESYLNDPTHLPKWEEISVSMNYKVLNRI